MPCTRVCSDSTVLAVENLKLNLICAVPGMTLFAPVPAWMFEICHVVGGKYSLPRSHSVCASSAIAGGHVVHRIAREVRIGDVALHAFDDELAGKRAAPAVLDHVAGALDRGRLADDAVVRLLAALGERLDHLHRAVGGGPFLVGSEQQRDRAAMIADARPRTPRRAATNAAIEVFMSDAPRPYRAPSRIVGSKGSLSH